MAMTQAVWQPWPITNRPGFEVQDPRGLVGLIQIDREKFWVTKPFRFADPAVEQVLVDRLVRSGMDAGAARGAVDEARTFDATEENPTDLASIPRYMRWFESSYGQHTLAAILHDELIEDEPNAGALRSDTLADRFFREMLRSAGVPWLKRWIMWAAVALRTRWAAKRWRRASVVLWIALALVGIIAFVTAVGAWWPGWDPPIDSSVLWLVAVVLPFGAAALWGRQYGAGLVAAIAALWILPAAVLAGVGYVVYLALEKVFDKLGFD